MSFTFNENNYEVTQENIEDKLISVLIGFDLEELLDIMSKNLVKKDLIETAIACKDYYDTMEDK